MDAESCIRKAPLLWPATLLSVPALWHHKPIMGVEMGDETDSTIQVVFRSYTGALVNFVYIVSSSTTSQ